MSEYVIHVEDAKTLYGHTDFPFPLDAYLREEIVRCEDCKYMSRETSTFKWCYRLSPEFACESDGFCAWGKRRES